MTKNTVYKKDFDRKRAVPNLIAHAKEYEKLKGPHLDLESTYLKDFNKTTRDPLERPHPEDSLKSGGPSPALTSYGAFFPGYRGGNQYVRPTDRHLRGHFPMRSRSTYSRHFPAKSSGNDDYTYFPDQLRTGKNWFGHTTYGNSFRPPNPEHYSGRTQVVDKL